MRNIVISLFCMGIVAWHPNQVWAQQDAVKQENEALKSRIQKLESQVEMLMKEREKAHPTVPQVEPQKIDEASLEELAQMVSEKQADSKKKGVWAGVDAQLYGYLRLDTAYDNSTCTTGAGGSYIKYVNSESSNKNDDQFYMTARRTRLGVKFTGPDSDNLKTRGRFEFDFSNGGSETSNTPRIRLAYVNLDWQKEQLSFLAGQEWDLFSPLNAPTIDAGVLWWSGNLGTRRPQLRLTKHYTIGENKLDLAAALARNIGNSNGIVTGLDIGEDSGQPVIQWRAGLTCNGLDNKKTKVGVSGHWGRLEYDTASNGDDQSFNSWSVNMDLTQPVTDWLTLKGEVFSGENLYSYTGGVGQGIDSTGLKGIESQGGWIAACINTDNRWKYNCGFGLDDVDADDLTNSTDITSNSTLFGNTIFAVNEKNRCRVGIGLSKNRIQGTGRRQRPSHTIHG